MANNSIQANSDSPAGQPGAPIDPELAVLRLARAAKLKDERHRQAISRKKRERALFLAIFSIIAIPAILLASFPMAMAKHIPGAVRLYSGLGMELNLRGLTIRDVVPELQETDGNRILSLEGTIENVSSTDQRIPPLRFAMLANGKEIFSWHLPASTRALKPGENTGFLTRIAAPPETAEKLEIRFAREGEIVLNAKP